MTRSLFCLLSAIALLGALAAPPADAQMKWTVGGNAGLSLLDGTAGFHIGPMAEMALQRNLAVGTELSINTQGGTHAIWYTYGKYHFALQGSKLKPYGDAGLLLDFATGGPYFGLLFGGGVNIPVAPKLAVAPELQMGPIFSVGGGSYTIGPFTYDVDGSTVFTVLIRAGIRYEL